jgi:hypothetical protein
LVFHSDLLLLLSVIARSFSSTPIPTFTITTFNIPLSYINLACDIMSSHVRHSRSCHVMPYPLTHSSSHLRHLRLRYPSPASSLAANAYIIAPITIDRLDQPKVRLLYSDYANSYSSAHAPVTSITLLTSYHA